MWWRRKGKQRGDSDDASAYQTTLDPKQDESVFQTGDDTDESSTNNVTEDENDEPVRTTNSPDDERIGAFHPKRIEYEYLVANGNTPKEAADIVINLGNSTHPVPPGTTFKDNITEQLYKNLRELGASHRRAVNTITAMLRTDTFVTEDEPEPERQSTPKQDPPAPQADDIGESSTNDEDESAVDAADTEPGDTIGDEERRKRRDMTTGSTTDQGPGPWENSGQIIARAMAALRREKGAEADHIRNLVNMLSEEYISIGNNIDATDEEHDRDARELEIRAEVLLQHIEGYVKGEREKVGLGRDPDPNPRDEPRPRHGPNSNKSIIIDRKMLSIADALQGGRGREVDEMRRLLAEFSNEYLNIEFDNSHNENEYNRLMDNLESRIDILSAYVDDYVKQRGGRDRDTSQYNLRGPSPLWGIHAARDAENFASRVNINPPREWGMEGGRDSKVLGWHNDVWSLDPLIKINPALIRRYPLRSREARDVAQAIARGRCTVRDCRNKEAVADATRIAERALHVAHAEYMDKSGFSSDEAIIRRAVEAFDRAYGLSWMRSNDVDLMGHPELRSYQTYYEAGMKPPTHNDMAIYAITNFGVKKRPPRKGSRMSRLIGTLADMPSAPPTQLRDNIRSMKESLRRNTRDPNQYVYDPDDIGRRPTAKTPIRTPIRKTKRRPKRKRGVSEMFRR